MRRAVMQLVLKSFTGWLTEKLPFSGRPFVYDFEEESVILINRVPAGSGPDFTNVERLTEDSLKEIYEYVFTLYLTSNTNSRAWSLAGHSLRLHALSNLKELLERIQLPPIPTRETMEAIVEGNK